MMLFPLSFLLPVLGKNCTVGKRLDRKYSEQNLGAPPSYEDAISATRSPTYSERNGESSPASAAKASVPPAEASPIQEISATSPPSVLASPPTQVDLTSSKNTGPEGWRLRQRHFETATSLVRSCWRFFPSGSALDIWSEFSKLA